MRPFVIAVVLVAGLRVGLGTPAQDYTGADLGEGEAAFMNACAVCHGPDGDAMVGVELNRPTLRRAATDADIGQIILNGIAGTPMPPSNLNPRQVDTIIGYVRSLGQAPDARLAAGDAANGRVLFEGKGNCLTCHRVNGRGSRTGPDLSEIGMTRRAAELEESLRDPNATIRSENRFLTVETSGGDAIRGRILNQNTQSVQVMGPDGRPASFRRREVTITPEPLSPMPSVGELLDDSEIQNLVAYLVSLMGLR